MEYATGRFERWTWEHALKIGRLHIYPWHRPRKPGIKRHRSPALDFTALFLPFLEISWIEREEV